MLSLTGIADPTWAWPIMAGCRTLDFRGMAGRMPEVQLSGLATLPSGRAVNMKDSRQSTVQAEMVEQDLAKVRLQVKRAAIFSTTMMSL